MTILYEIQNKLYLNITNKCPCACTFCIRNNSDNAYGSDPLWLEHEPVAKEVLDELYKKDLNSYDEIIYCGFGEPTASLDILIESGKYIKSKTNTLVRLNTNGLSDLVNNKPTAHLLEGIVDIVSISLNAGSKEEYLKVTQPVFGEQAFEAMQEFILDCKKYIPSIIVSVVDVIAEEEIEKAKELSEKLGVPLRIRTFDE